MRGRLYRTRGDRMIAGVAGGLARYLDLDPSIVRVLWAILGLLTGVFPFLVLYVVMAIVVPEEPWGEAIVVPEEPWGEAPAQAPPGGGPPPETGAPSQSGWQAPAGWQGGDAWRAASPQPRGERTGAIVFGLILIGVGGFFLLLLVAPALDVGRYWPAGIIALGVLLVLGSLVRR